MTDLAHFHGYGPWIGRPDQYHAEYLRRPAPFDATWQAMVSSMKSPDQEAHLPFEQRTIPPMQTGHWLLRRPPYLGRQTWAEPKEAAEWLAGMYDQYPPAQRTDGAPTDIGTAAKAGCATTALTHGTDVVWVHYLPGERMFSASVVACPNRFHPHTPCPYPLS
ncbi:hypothetical protein ACIQF6_01065 [Kitasatospora sp. NPDC092948]|uniref:hypothetical protein n=1 Tax=Kitasatospora sp. NPDC092948 TaxID=3364088 RepID=UPI003804633A